MYYMIAAKPACLATLQYSTSHFSSPFAPFSLMRSFSLDPPSSSPSPPPQARKLTDSGKQLAGQAAADWYKANVAAHSTFAVCSPTQRCMETCKVMGEKIGKMPVVKQVCHILPQMRFKAMRAFGSAESFLLKSQINKV